MTTVDVITIIKPQDRRFLETHVVSEFTSDNIKKIIQERNTALKNIEFKELLDAWIVPTKVVVTKKGQPEPWCSCQLIIEYDSYVITVQRIGVIGM